MTLINYKDYSDPFSVDNYTRLIYLNKGNKLSAANSGALLSRYSRSTKSMIDLYETEFKQDKERGKEFYKKVLLEYGDDSVGEMDNETFGIEGLSILAASKLTDRRIGISFIEKSTRYVPYTEKDFYIPSEIYEMGLADEFKDLCYLSYSTFKYIYNELYSILREKYQIQKCYFFDSEQQKEVPFENMKSEVDIKSAEKAYEQTIKAKAYDTASYCYLVALKTNIGFNTNCRTLEYLIKHMNSSPITELKQLGNNFYDLISPYLSPLVSRAEGAILSTNNLGIYDKTASTVSLYKHNITNFIQTYDLSDDGEHDGDNNKFKETERKYHNDYNMNFIKTIVSEMTSPMLSNNKEETKQLNPAISGDSFIPSVELVYFMNEKWCIDTLCASILYENNENLLEYDEMNLSNINNNLRLVDLDKEKIKQGLVYDILNGNSSLNDLTTMKGAVLNRASENNLSFNEISAYFNQTDEVRDNVMYQDYQNDNKLTMTKEQEYLVNKYVGNRKSRRDKLGRAFETIDYMFEISCSFRTFREYKRHRMGTILAPQVLTTRNSLDNYIIPQLIQDNPDLFQRYKKLIVESFKLYKKIIEKSNDYHVAQYANILATRMNFVHKTNFREYDYLLSLRSTPQAHEEFRLIAQTIYVFLRTIHPNLAKYMKFVDLDEVNLNRLDSEFKKEKKLGGFIK